jgi:hypothetical protein
MCMTVTNQQKFHNPIREHLVQSIRGAKRTGLSETGTPLVGVTRYVVCVCCRSCYPRLQRDRLVWERESESERERMNCGGSSCLEKGYVCCLTSRVRNNTTFSKRELLSNNFLEKKVAKYLVMHVGEREAFLLSQSAFENCVCCELHHHFSLGFFFFSSSSIPFCSVGRGGKTEMRGFPFPSFRLWALFHAREESGGEGNNVIGSLFFLCALTLANHISI